jgi:hypothetical protein
VGVRRHAVVEECPRVAPLLGALKARRQDGQRAESVAGVVIVEEGRAITVMGFTVSGGKIVEIDGVTDRDRLARIDVGGLA